MSMNKLTARPGETIILNLTLQPHKEPSTVTRVELLIPDDAHDGMVKVIVADAKTARNFEKVRAPYNFRPENLNQLIDLLQAREQNNDIVVMLYRPTHGITLEGEEFPSPPSSLISIMSLSKTKGDVAPTKGSVLLKKRISTDYFIVGNLNMNLAIDHNAQ